MSTVQVDTINESTTGSGVTIDGVLLQDGNVDGVDVATLNTTVSGLTSNPAYTIYDAYALSSDRSSTGDITVWTALGTVGGAGINSIGSAVSHSSGVFTFPETGIYKIVVKTHCDLPSARNFRMNTQVTNNNSTYTTIASSSGSWNENNEGQVDVYHTALVDVTDTSNVKVKFNLSGTFGSYTRVRGNSTRTETFCSFTKVADT